jgi:hypothetical protein
MRKNYNIEYTFTDEYGKYWCKGDRDTFHRLDGPAVERTNGAKEYWVDGVQHRLGGPAAEYPNGHKEWVVNGVLHRVEGPAVIHSDGSEFWFVNGEQLDCKTQEEFEQLMKLKAFW